MIFLYLLPFACQRPEEVTTCDNTTLSFSQADLDTIGRQKYSPYHNEGPQVVAFDVDQDGQIEVLQCFMDEPLLQYGHTETTVVTDLCGAMAIIDWNQDGWSDLVMEVQSNELRRSTTLWWFENRQGQLVKHHETSFGVDQIHSFRVGDLNGDGLEDIYASVLAERNDQSDQNVILWAHEDFKVDQSLQMDHASRKTFDSALADFDLNGTLDIIDANDRGAEYGGNVLWWNNNGSFTPDHACHCLPIQDAMGVDVADVNRDGWLDIITGDVNHNHLLINDNGSSFSDVSQAWGVDQLEPIEMSWGVRLVDINNDGAVDIVSAMGDHTYPGMEEAEYEGPLGMSMLQQSPDGFIEKASDWGMSSMGSFRSIIPLHWNDDGILDYWITDVEEAPQLWLSDSCTNNNWLNIEAPNGTMVKLRANGVTWTGQVHGQSSYGANRSPHWHVGLSKVTQLQSMEVRFPNQEWQEWIDIPTLNQTITLHPEN